MVQLRQYSVSHGAILSVLMSLLFVGIACLNQEKRYNASSWPEADLLFRRDPIWVGADDAYSVALDSNRTLWLFADSGIDTMGRHSRHTAELIRNSIAVQTGSNPSSAKIAFFWRKNNLGQPAAFFLEQGEDWFWPGHGIRLNDRLILFLMRVRGIDTGLGFEVYDWEAVSIHNLAVDPLHWELQSLRIPKNKYQVIVGSASVLEIGEYVYAFGSREGIPHKPIYVTRWPSRDFAQGDLSGIEWWDKSQQGWMRQSELEDIPEPVFQNGQTEFSVHFDARIGKYLCIQTVEFGASNIYYRTADDITGPWSEPIKLFEPPEKNRPNIMIYAAKAHSQLLGADLLLTYATNTFEFAELLSDSLIYYPRFVRLNLGD